MTNRNNHPQIEFETPPPLVSPQERGKRGGARGKYLAQALAMRENPGEWVVIYRDKAADQAPRFRRGKVPGFADPTVFEFAARSRATGDGPNDRRHTLYGRFIGHEVPEDALDGSERPEQAAPGTEGPPEAALAPEAVKGIVDMVTFDPGDVRTERAKREIAAFRAQMTIDDVLDSEAQ